MDIHRCRFIEFPPSSINSLAFSHSRVVKDQKTASPRLAVGRANGDIEIWNPLRGAWFQETTIRGGKDRSIDGLVWTQDPNEEVGGKTMIGKSRLFSIGYTTTVTEWDLEKGQPLRQASGNHGEIWCIAAQPALAPENAANGEWQGQSLIAGCTDGALVLYSTKDDELQLQKLLVKPSAKKAKIISVVFQGRNIVVAGCTDSVIRIYDIRSGSLLRSMTTGAGPKGGPKEVIVWSVKVLQDGTIVSGDSTGELKIWDGKTYTLRQRIQSHRQDILSLSTSHDGSTIFSGGMDRRTVMYKRDGRAKNRWNEVAHRRFHSHDVKTMASFEGNGMSVVVSGGPDASPTIVPLDKFGFENQRALSFLPQEQSIFGSPKERLLLSWWEREVRIWRIEARSEGQFDDEIAKGRKLVAKILIKGDANITSASLSVDGNLLAVSTLIDVKVFQLRPKQDQYGTLRISKISLPSKFSSGARLVQFSPDCKWLCIIRSDSHIALARILSASSITFHPSITKIARLDRKTPKLITLGGLGTYDRTITQVAFSSDSRILAVSDLAGYVDTFFLSGYEDVTEPIPNEDSDAASSTSDSDLDSDRDEDEEEEKFKPILGQHWARNPLASSLPNLPATPVVLSFRPSKGYAAVLTNGITPPATRNTPHPISHELPIGDDRLLVVTATSEIYEFSVLQGGLTDWSRRNPPSAFPDNFRQNLEIVKGVVWDVKSHEKFDGRIWLWSVGFLWMFDLSQDLFTKLQEEDESEEGTKKRKRGGKKITSGAGGEVPGHELGMGIGRKVRKVEDFEKEDGVEEDLDLFPEDAMDIDDEDDEAETLSVLRKGSELSGEREVIEEDSGEDVPGRGAINHPLSRKRYRVWHTYKYRPILGVAVIGEQKRAEKPEVTIVERPIWEVDLPPRYYGEQEWRDKEVMLWA